MGPEQTTGIVPAETTMEAIRVEYVEDVIIAMAVILGDVERPANLNEVREAKGAIADTLAQFAFENRGSVYVPGNMRAVVEALEPSTRGLLSQIFSVKTKAYWAETTESRIRTVKGVLDDIAEEQDGRS